MVLRVFRSKKFAKRVLLGLCLMIIPAFVLWGVGSIGRRPPIVGTIAGDSITHRDLAESRDGLRIQLIFSQMHDMEQLRHILNHRQILNYMAWERLVFLTAARKEQVRITDEQVQRFITNHPRFSREGRFDHELYTAIVTNTFRVEQRKFEELVRQNLMIQIFRGGLLNEIEVTDEELLEQFHERHDKVIFSYFVLPRNMFREEVTVTEEELRDLHEKHKDIFMSPEQAAAEYIYIPFSSSTERTAALSRMENLFLSLKDTDDFADEADQLGFTVSSTGLFPSDRTIPGMEFSADAHRALMALEEGELSRPVISGTTEGAVYLIFRSRKVPPEYRTFEKARDEVRELLLLQKTQELAMKKATRTFGSLASGELSLEEAAKETGLTIVTSEAVDRNGFLPQVGSAENLVSAALRHVTGGIIPPRAVRDGVVMARIDEIIRADTAEFKARKEILRESLLAQKQMDRMQRWFKEEAPQVELKVDFSQI